MNISPADREPAARTDSVDLALQLERCERDGLEAHARGALRRENPYVGPLSTACDGETLQALAEHWWRGWDSWGAQTCRRRRMRSA